MNCVIMRCKECHGLIFSAYESWIDDETKRDIGDYVLKGYTIEHVSTDVVRNSDWCKCRAPHDLGGVERPVP